MDIKRELADKEGHIESSTNRLQLQRVMPCSRIFAQRD